MDKNSQISDSDVNVSFADESQTNPTKTRKKFSCNECEKSFAYEVTLKCHVNVVHKKMKLVVVDERKPKPKKIRCNECGKSFVCKEILKTHVDVVHEKYYTLDVVQKE